MKEVEAAAMLRPNQETLTEELEELGFEDVDVSVTSTQLTFDGGRAFTEDPTTRLMILPDLLATADIDDLGSGLGYVRDAVDKYWSESEFSLTVNVGVVSARKT